MKKKREKNKDGAQEPSARKKKSFMIGLWCTAEEKEIIHKNADNLGLPDSQYLYNLAFKVRHKNRVLPAEALRLKAEVFRLGHDTNMIYKMLSRGDSLEEEEKRLHYQALKEVTEVMKLLNKILQ